MSRARTSVIVVGGSLVLAVMALVVGARSATPNVNFKDAAAVLALSTAMAVGIERVLEGGWTIIGQLANTWWPMSVPAQALQSLVSDLNATLRPVYTQVEAALADGQKAQQLGADKVNEARDMLNKVKAWVNDVQVGPTGSSQRQLSAALALSGLDYFTRLEGSVADRASAGRTALKQVANFLVTFENNPARKMVSLYAGSVLGLALAGVFGLDLVHAAAGTNPSGAFHWGVIATGVIIGLGSNPAHEIIRSIQEYKNSRKAG